MSAPESDFGTALQHQFSKSRWSKHSETAFKVHLPFWVIKLPKSSPWPTNYIKDNRNAKLLFKIMYYICLVIIYCLSLISDFNNYNNCSITC